MRPEYVVMLAKSLGQNDLANVIDVLTRRLDEVEGHLVEELVAYERGYKDGKGVRGG